MSAHLGFASRLDDLPACLPVFPLPGVLLLPRGRLPLNIFEPRYLAMTDDALGAPGRLIGMIQPADANADLGPRGPPARLYPIGCAGRIASFSETEDGRYLISLAGVCRFTIAAELAGAKGYRRVRPDFAPWQADLGPADLGAPDAPAGIDRARLLGALKTYFTVEKIEADWAAIADTPDERLVTTLAMVCPFQPPEKQALLEARTMAERARTILALLEMAAQASGAGPSGEGGARRH